MLNEYSIQTIPEREIEPESSKEVEMNNINTPCSRNSLNASIKEPRNEIQGPTNDYSNMNLKKFSSEDFEFGPKLGKGKFGDVYLARDKKTNFLVALKILDKDTIRHLKAQKQIIREIKIHSY